MTRNEFVLMRVKDERRMYRGITIVWALAAVGSLAALVAGFIMRGPRALFFLGAAFGCGVSALHAHSMAKAHDQALAELGDDPSGAHDAVDYSASTQSILDNVWRSPQILAQMAVAYGVCAVPMIAGGILIVVIAEDNLVLALLGALLALGGLVLVELTVRALRTRKALIELGDVY